MSRAYADLPLHYGAVPPWLAARMSLLGGAIIETIIADYGKAEVLRRLSDPCWFQALGCVLGMDWHSSGITTSVMGALKKALNPRAHELGIYICGGKGKHSRQTPQELMAIADKTGLPGHELVRNSKLAAKVDNTALQDGFQLYLHSFIVSNEGDWAVVQQGMNDDTGMARRYHWHSATVRNFTETPHSFIYGKNQGLILNLTDKEAMPTKDGLLELVKVAPSELLPEIRKITMPSHHDVRSENVDLKRLGAVLAVAHERQVLDFETLLLMEGVGPRTLQSLTLVSEVIHGTPSRFTDPARFSFAHGGKDGHPFPVPVNVYDETISVMREAVNKAKIGQNDKQEAIRKLSVLSQQVEKDFIPNERFDEVVTRERNDSWKHGGRTIFGKEKPPPPKNNQLSLFD
ncbi:DUF763 domain-containing protein [Chitinophaga silvisoli]|uniref:DUF763 domain-containing protein n=1 Tax=Chitinophaga silvisoli TaxID=2291814 RepID=A0A3E1NZJ1_9BACT|nr:DUF763 domain-containing protein [Chitinophaga silvisoli]RFM33367.1 DUF763 domain-containing protein [Chitinophaga silvisoli]